MTAMGMPYGLQVLALAMITALNSWEQLQLI